MLAMITTKPQDSSSFNDTMCKLDGDALVSKKETSLYDIHCMFQTVTLGPSCFLNVIDNTAKYLQELLPYCRII